MGRGVDTARSPCTLSPMRIAALCLLLGSSVFPACGRSASRGTLAAGDAFEGTLTADDVTDYEGVTTEAVELRYEGGAALAVVVTSAEMDPFAILAVGGSPVGVASGVAGGPGACVVLSAPHPLRVVVYVSSAGAEPYGPFRVSAEPATEQVIAEHDCQTGRGVDPSPGLPPPGERTITV